MALWWVDVALSLACGLAVPFLMFTRQTHELPGMTALWLLPVVACEVASVSGGLLIAHVANADTQLTILVTSLVLWACSVPLALSILAILFMRLVLHKLPPVGMAATSWLALGPIGTGALSLLVMSQTAPPVLAAHGLGTIASAFAGSCLLGGLLLWGYGIWWLGMACLMTLRYLRDRIPFNLGWWGYTFPLGVFAAATARLSTIIPIGPIGWLVAALALALALVWLLVFVRTMSGILDRSLFVSPCLAAD
jgi:tellurite resistance protein TehA-like permease